MQRYLYKHKCKMPMQSIEDTYTKKYEGYLYKEICKIHVQGHICRIPVQSLQLHVALGIRVHIRQAARQRKEPVFVNECLESAHKDPEDLVTGAVCACLLVLEQRAEL